MTADEDETFRKALRTLMTQGFSFGIPSSPARWARAASTAS
jgi:hypothetical protein